MKKMQIAVIASAAAIALAGILGGCGTPYEDGTEDDPSSSPDDTGGSPSSSKGKGSSGSGSGGGFGAKQDIPPDADTTTYPEGAQCPTKGAVTFCWTGPAADRGRGTCRDGTQTCEARGEFPVWSACKGQVTDCDKDAGPPPVKCEGDCVPGATRWCDAPTFCSWGKQKCMPSRTWGQCTETNDTPKGCERPGSRQYVPSCCIAAGECCQNPSFTSKGANFPSAGKCDGIACPGSMSQ